MLWATASPPAVRRLGHCEASPDVSSSLRGEARGGSQGRVDSKKLSKSEPLKLGDATSGLCWSTAFGQLGRVEKTRREKSPSASSLTPRPAFRGLATASGCRAAPGGPARHSAKRRTATDLRADAKGAYIISSHTKFCRLMASAPPTSPAASARTASAFVCVAASSRYAVSAATSAKYVVVA